MFRPTMLHGPPDPFVHVADDTGPVVAPADAELNVTAAREYPDPVISVPADVDVGAVEDSASFADPENAVSGVVPREASSRCVADVWSIAAISPRSQSGTPARGA